MSTKRSHKSSLIPILSTALSTVISFCIPVIPINLLLSIFNQLGHLYDDRPTINKLSDRGNILHKGSKTNKPTYIFRRHFLQTWFGIQGN